MQLGSRQCFHRPNTKILEQGATTLMKNTRCIKNFTNEEIATILKQEKFEVQIILQMFPD